MQFLTRLFRRLRGLGTCPECLESAAEIADARTFAYNMRQEGGEMQATLDEELEQVRRLVEALRAESKILRAENRLLSRRLMVHEMKAAKRKRDDI